MSLANHRNPEIDAKIASHKNATLPEGPHTALRRMKEHCFAEHRGAEAPVPVPLSAHLILALRNDLEDRHRRGSYILLGGSAYAHLLSSVDLHSYLDPVVNPAKLLSGDMGVLLGMGVYSDSFFHPEEQELARDTLYVMAADGTVGIACLITAPVPDKQPLLPV